MSEAKETLPPEILQIQLVSIYKSLPQRRAAVSRMRKSAQNSAIDTEKNSENGTNYNILVEEFRAGLEHVKRAELPKMQLERLEGLLAAAQITQASKKFIKTAFEACFWLGVDEPDDDIWIEFNIIGVSDESRMETGIFSKDPETRKKIERGIYKLQSETFADLQRDYPNGEEQEAISSVQLELGQLEKEFEDLYGEPI